MARLAYDARESYGRGAYTEHIGRLFPRYRGGWYSAEIARGYDAMFKLAQEYLRLPKSER